MPFQNKGVVRIVNLKEWRKIEIYNGAECDITDYFAWGAFSFFDSPVSVQLFAYKEEVQCENITIPFAYLAIVGVPKEKIKNQADAYIEHQEQLLYPFPVGLVPCKYLGTCEDENNRYFVFVITDKELFKFFTGNTLLTASFN